MNRPRPLQFSHVWTPRASHVLHASTSPPAVIRVVDPRQSAQVMLPVPSQYGQFLLALTDSFFASIA